MSTVFTKNRAVIQVSRGLRPGFVSLPRPMAQLGIQGRVISSGPKEDGDLGGPGGSEATPARISQNRRLAFMTGGAVLAIVAAYSVMTGQADKVAPLPTRSTEEVVNKKQNHTPADKGLRAFRSD